MDWDWKKTLGTVAPTIATALGGPLAGLAVQAIGGIFGLGDNPTEDQLKTAMQGATPADFLALKKAEQDFLVRMEELGIERERLVFGDRDSARKREMEVKDYVPGALAIMLTVGFFGLLGWMMYKAPPEGSRDLLNIMLGSLGTAWAGMIAYYFGSSAGSARKDELLARK
jgi:hypothetical protein